MKLGKDLDLFEHPLRAGRKGNVFLLRETVGLHELIDFITTTLDARDPYTFEHSFRVAQYSEAISFAMGLNSEIHERIHIAAHIHDIGKVGVSDRVLNKPGKLTKEEMEEMKRHSRIGYNILQRLPLFQKFSDIVLYHHERADGQGYPKGLSEENIPLESKIIAVADAFDAMTSDRPYRVGMSLEEAAREINEHSGEQFSPIVVEHFNRVLHHFPRPSQKHSFENMHYAFVGL